MWGTLERMWASTSTPVRASNDTPAASSPMLWTLGPRPVATSTRSALTSPPLASASWKVTVTLFLPSTTAVARAPRWVAMPRFLKARASSLEASASSIGISRSSISTIVTSTPQCCMIEANSTPITPPPITTSRSGSSVISSRPVESTHRGPSIPSTGGRSEWLPVAMIADLKVTSSWPSTAIVCASLKLPRPGTIVMPLALTTPVMPLTRPLTMPSLFCWVCGKSSSAPDTLTPSREKVWLASFSAWAVATHALVGMQPTVMHVPPTRPCSISTTLAPSWAARMAAGYPPGPPPRTATSHSMGTRSSGSLQNRMNRS